MVHVMRGHYLVLDPLIVQGYCFLGCRALIQEQIFDNKLILIVIAHF